MTVRVILADDQPLVRAGLRMLLDQTPDIDVAGEAGTGTEAVKLVRDTGPARSGRPHDGPETLPGS
jgi:DNA-binding NarL/FixJ family response regulator